MDLVESGRYAALKAFEILMCPRCEGHVNEVASSALVCPNCGFVCSRAQEGYYDLLSSSRLPDFDWRLKCQYVEICNGGGPVDAWGERTIENRGYRELYFDQRRYVEKYAPKALDVLVDVSAGCGIQLAALATLAQLGVHVEAHRASLRAAAQRYTTQAVKNVALFRGTYLALPLQTGCAGVVTAFDTLERGPMHDKLLLAEIARVLRQGGLAFVDFHARGRTNHSVLVYQTREVVRLFEGVGLRPLDVRAIGYGPTVARSGALRWALLKAAAWLARLPSRRLVIAEKL